MKRIIVLLLVTIFVALITWIGWTFQPWMSAGRAVHISSTRLGEYDFQVWQRKNKDLTEPFATGLFARKQGGQWRAFLLDFQDSYHPQIFLRKQDSGIAVLYGREKLGFFDERQQTYRRESNGRLDTGAVLDSEPPGNWWLAEAYK
jgi:hypothetical protein